MSGAIYPVQGLPGMGAADTATHRHVFKGGFYEDFLPGGRYINGTKSRDPGNSDVTILRAGMLMGKVTSGGRYAPSIIGVGLIYAAGATTFTVSAAVAVEIVRRIGTTGTFLVTGPPVASGNVTQETATFSAVDTTTGDITVTALTNSYLAGALISQADGSQYPVTVIPDGYGISVTDNNGSSADQYFSKFPVAGMIETAQLINYPSDPSLAYWLKSQLLIGGPQFTFDDDY